MEEMISLNSSSTILTLANGKLAGSPSFIIFIKLWSARVRGCVAQSFPTCRNQGAYLSITNPQSGNMSPPKGYKNKEYDKLSLHDCGVKCLNNCSCFAFSHTNDDNSGCQIWSRGSKFASSNYGRPIYFIPGNITTNGGKSKANMRKLWIESVIGGALLIPVSAIVFYVLWLWRKHIIEAKQKWKRKKMLYDIGGIATPSQSPVYSKRKRSKKIHTTKYGMHMFSFESIESATDNFSSANKLGEGGFGPVYKGQLLDGREIAIKRLSTSSWQGLTEFKNEVKLIAKLQHTNLVKLHGFCIEREERMLIYEYMPNKSLDFYLFDSKNKILLDWKRRLGIIQGITRGIVYLHTYSRLTVIHRDLKPSNILLDSDMNPKISDFGLARIFGLKESKQNTNRVVGTYGYMSPEYALNGIVSPKIDVFSFGVMVLEIISGKKNASIYASDYPHSLLGRAWELWNTGKALELIDPILNGSCDVNEVLRCIHISLLCVQDQAEDRPTMSDVVFFLSGEAIQLARPKQLALFPHKKNKSICPIIDQNVHSINSVTISTLSAR
ncbi:G-type lectin S-receptor-like serine/threonine-protein kinase CES101 isoform X2 [Lotus japonicus]|uniref:G-type lectin S-receptor-like serine/threonine-protein kinase CES101 isoform X2 n=1 Tax=Lotus japonicus TaxID=34305 RepID=UPI00258D1DA5|nr:G-type lectin S-receptor-like serine/threonine-protein kinase CES101 isoform X2 [Lotus japonicus]